MRKPPEDTGFRPPTGHPLGRERRTAMVAELIATIGLALSTIVAATALSVGIARANVAGGVIENEGSLFGIALLLGLAFIIAVGGFSILPGERQRKN